MDALLAEAWRKYEQNFCCEDDDGWYSTWPEFLAQVAQGGEVHPTPWSDETYWLADDEQLRRLDIQVSPELQAAAQLALRQAEIGTMSPLRVVQ